MRLVGLLVFLLFWAIIQVASSDRLVGQIQSNRRVLSAKGTCEPISPTVEPTTFPSHPTFEPSYSPTKRSTSQPSAQPSKQPSCQPSSRPSAPSGQPTGQPSRLPSNQPSSQPSRQPSRQPTKQPSKQPSSRPSVPSGQPSAQPSRQPSRQPTRQPSRQPSRQPTRQPSRQPSHQPTRQPSRQPTRQPSLQPSRQPTSAPSTSSPTSPSFKPTFANTHAPSTSSPTSPSFEPTLAPTHAPSSPTLSPTLAPISPTLAPSAIPTIKTLPTLSRAPIPSPTALPSARPSYALAVYCSSNDDCNDKSGYTGICNLFPAPSIAPDSPTPIPTVATLCTVSFTFSGSSASSLLNSQILQHALVVAISLVLAIPEANVGTPVVTARRRALTSPVPVAGEEESSLRRLTSAVSVSMTVTSSLSAASVSSSLKAQTGQLSDAFVNQATADGYALSLSLSLSSINVIETSPTSSPSFSTHSPQPPPILSTLSIIIIVGACLCFLLTTLVCYKVRTYTMTAPDISEGRIRRDWPHPVLNIRKHATSKSPVILNLPKSDANIILPISSSSSTATHWKLAFGSKALLEQAGYLSPTCEWNDEITEGYVEKRHEGHETLYFVRMSITSKGRNLIHHQMTNPRRSNRIAQDSSIDALFAAKAIALNER